MRKTKIICTLGPAVDSVESLKQLLLSGMNGARFNFSHGTHESQMETLEKLRTACAETGCNVAMILDTKGPEIRIKTFAGGPIQLSAGDSFTLCTDEVEGNEQMVSVTYSKLADELEVGCTVLIDDGLVSMTVEKIENGRIQCRVENGGELSNNKSINIPGVAISLPTLTDKDRSDLQFAVENDFDYIAASFVRSAADVREIRSTLDSFGGQDIRIIAKIENQQGVDNMDEIFALSDGIMVARGDLGVEIPAAKVPTIQKQMIDRARYAGKVVIIATQMLDSMIHNPRPTRAEVSDVANAVFDRASCVMLSGETANGKYPIKSLTTMSEIIEEAEKAVYHWDRPDEGKIEFSNNSISDAMTHTCCMTAKDLSASAILTATQSGYTARMLSRFRPQCPIVALTPIEKVYRQLSLSWGVIPFLSAPVGSTDSLLTLCVNAAKGNGIVKTGDTVVITAGVPIGRSGSTNLIKAQVIA